MKDGSMPKMLFRLVVIGVLMLGNTRMVFADEPPAINPFGPPPTERQDAVPGYVELSDGSIHPGLIYLTRDKALKIYDQQLQRQREIPLSDVKQIECTIKKEWREKQWKFQESTKDDKLYTGQSYPAREYEHTITLQDGRTITGGLSAIVYVQPYENASDQAGAVPERHQSRAIHSQQTK